MVQARRGLIVRALMEVAASLAPLAVCVTVTSSAWSATMSPRSGVNVRFCRCGGDVSGAEAVLVAVPGGLVADALGAVTGIESKTVIGAPTRSGQAAGRPCPQLRVPQVADRRPGGQTSASRSIRPDFASVVAAWRRHGRAVGTSCAASGWSSGRAGEGPSPGDTGKPPDPGLGVRAGICVRDLEFWIHPAFPVLSWRASRPASWRTHRWPTCQARCHAGHRRLPPPVCGYSWPDPPPQARIPCLARYREPDVAARALASVQNNRR
jgi:hypothetical protein